jgi:uncharacterized integral membrane protein
MTDFNDIKNIWRNQKDANVPPVDDIIKKIKKDRNKIMLKNIFSSILLLLTLAVVTAVLFAYDFEYATTRLGIVIVILAIIGALFMNTQLLRIISGRIDDSSDTSSYLNELIRYRHMQRIIHTKGITIYFLVLTMGMMLYLFEFAVRNKIFGIAAYSLTLGWIAFVWFYLRPRTIKKQEARINGLIKQAETISQQLHSE